MISMKLYIPTHIWSLLCQIVLDLMLIHLLSSRTGLLSLKNCTGFSQNVCTIEYVTLPYSCTCASLATSDKSTLQGTRQTPDICVITLPDFQKVYVLMKDVLSMLHIINVSKYRIRKCEKNCQDEKKKVDRYTN